MTFIDLPTRPDPRFILTTHNLTSRAVRQGDLAAEALIMREVTRLVSDNPKNGIKRFLDLTMQLCEAGSAGLSTITNNAEGIDVFYWDEVSGALEAFTGATTPIDYSPCSLCLAAGESVLVEHPERAFSYFPPGIPEIVEGLIVPLHDARKVALGTIWIVSHDDARRFDAETVRQMEMLAPLLVLALKLRASEVKLDKMLAGIGQVNARSRLSA